VTGIESDAVYVLRREFSHLTAGVEVDAWLVEFPGWRNISWLLTKEYELPERIQFKAVFEALHSTDYPLSNVRWPLVSRKMLDMLRSVGDFPHRAIPVEMINCKVRGGSPVSILDDKDHGFFILQLTQHLDAFDWEKSVFTPHPRLTNRVSRIEKLSLKEPIDGFPPIFQLSVYLGIFFVSAQARMALEGEGIKGIEFRDIDDPWL
jgi:hypothetical protein